MQAALREVAAEIDRVIADDAFPETVQPAFLRDSVRDYPGRGGKRLRPALLLWCCGLLGGELRRAWLPAAAVEVWHNWTLVHDDIIDRDALRRGVPTAHCRLRDAVTAIPFHQDGAEAERQGMNFAVLCGDLQQAWANHLLSRAVESGLRADTVTGALRRMQELGGRALISGEALDVAFSLRSPLEIEPGEVLEMIRLKTGALLRLAAELGAMVALDDAAPEREETRMLGDFAEACGVAFQLRDDYLGIFGSETKLGKAIGNDLKEAKPTVLLLRTLTLATPAVRQELLASLHGTTYTQEQLEQVRRWMLECGAAESVTEDCRKLVEKARKLLMVFPASRYRDYLLEFTDYLTARDR